jgi:HPt (histidine-containing phosphotransfer) domain-containing protein
MHIMATICPACLHPNPLEAAACIQCGKRFDDIEKCTACNATVFVFSRFCYECGVSIQPRKNGLTYHEKTIDLDPSTNMLTGDILDQEVNEVMATTFHTPAVRLLHRPTSVFYDLPLLISPITIGKRSDSFTPDLDLKDFPESEFISRNHAQISFLPKKFYIEDVGSKNGTALNGVPLPAEQPQPLAFGDRICFGGSEAFVFIFMKDQPLNLEHLRTISGNDREFELELLTSYVESVKGLLQSLQYVLESRDFAGVKPLASQVAIASYNVGADVMNLLAKQMEDQAMQQAITVCEKTLISMQDGLVQVDRFVKVFYHN